MGLDFQIFYGDFLMDIFLVLVNVYLAYLIGVRKYGRYIDGYSIFDGGLKKFAFHFLAFIIVGLLMRLLIMLSKISWTFKIILIGGGVVLFMYVFLTKTQRFHFNWKKSSLLGGADIGDQARENEVVNHAEANLMKSIKERGFKPK